MTQIKLKKYLVLLGVSLSLAGIVYGYIQYNLARYSVYYASHMPRKEEAKPELIMALENINWIDKQNTENIYFHEDREDIIYLNKDAYFKKKKKYTDYYVRLEKKNGLNFYYTDSIGKFRTYSSPDNWEEKPLEEVSLQELENLLAPATKDIVKAQKTPTINLQKLFNQKYESRFNH